MHRRRGATDGGGEKETEIVDEKEREVEAEAADGVGPRGGANQGHGILNVGVREGERADLAGEPGVVFLDGEHGLKEISSRNGNGEWLFEASRGSAECA